MGAMEGYTCRPMTFTNKSVSYHSDDELSNEFISLN